MEIVNRNEHKDRTEEGRKQKKCDYKKGNNQNGNQKNSKTLTNITKIHPTSKLDDEILEEFNKVYEFLRNDGEDEEDDPMLEMNWMTWP